jgi:K+ transporter
MSSFSQPKCKSPSIHNLNNEIKKINIDILKNNNSHNIKTQNAISNMLDVINDNNLNLFYKDGMSKFKYNIDQLNLKFYLETEKILSSTQSDLSQNQNKLFLILFKQITLYIKEIERLNLLLIEESKNPNYLKKKVSFIEKQN